VTKNVWENIQNVQKYPMYTAQKAQKKLISGKLLKFSSES
jgi:hypothetical protein